MMGISQMPDSTREGHFGIVHLLISFASVTSDLDSKRKLTTDVRRLIEFGVLETARPDLNRP